MGRMLASAGMRRMPSRCTGRQASEWLEASINKRVFEDGAGEAGAPSKEWRRS